MINALENIVGNNTRDLSESLIMSIPDTLVIGDIHYTGRVRAFFGGASDGWNEYWASVFSWIRSTAIKNKVKNIIFLGDITDDIPTKFSVAWYINLFTLFSKAVEGFNTYIVSGNHDMNTDGSYDVLNLLKESLPNIFIDTENMYNYNDGSAYRKGTSNKVISSNIGYGHDIFGWEKNDFFGVPAIKITDIFTGKIFITGHIHTPCYESKGGNNQVLINLGSIVPTSVDMLNAPRYVMLLNSEDLNYGFIPVPNWEKDWNTVSASKIVESMLSNDVVISLSDLKDFWTYMKNNLNDDSWNYLSTKLKDKEGK